MEQSTFNKILFGSGLFFIAFIALVVAKEQYFLMGIPFGLALMALTFLALDKVLWFILFTTPLSIEVFIPDLHVGMSLPNEPFMAGLLLLFIVKLLYEGNFDPKISTHPISIALIIHLVWMFITCIMSEMPFVSFKYFIARTWFVVVFFYFFSQLLIKPKNLKFFFWIYIIPLLGVIVYAVTRHIEFGLTKRVGTWVMTPFFREHTNYGAALALYFPAVFVLAFAVKEKLNWKAMGLIAFVILSIGLILSFTRAAWISVAAAGAVYLILLARIRWTVLFSGAMAILLGIFLNWGNIMMKLEKNRKESSDDLQEHVKSISNVSSDASNLERINRWKSAYRMFQERPVFGWGPGTYMFQYAPFQKPHEKTIISTNNADLGNAHSEYFGPLAEMGLPGLLTVLYLILQMLISGHNIYFSKLKGQTRTLVLAAYLGLITYFTHGFLNNFLDIDKTAGPVFAFLAVLVVAERYYIPKMEEDSKLKN